MVYDFSMEWSYRVGYVRFVGHVIPALRLATYMLTQYQHSQSYQLLELVLRHSRQLVSHHEVAVTLQDSQQLTFSLSRLRFRPLRFVENNLDVVISRPTAAALASHLSHTEIHSFAR